MAQAKKTTKKATPAKAPTLEQLSQDLATKREDLLQALRGHRAGELTNPRVLSALKKDIARLMTAIREHELTPKESN